MAKRRSARVAAYVGAAVTAAGAVALGVIGGQVLFARRTIPAAQAPPPNSGGRYGRHYAGQPVRLAVLGDSTAAGYGVHTRAQTPGALLATAVAQAAQRPVELTCPAAVGSLSAWLPAQAETVVETGPCDLAAIFIGANDVTAGVSAERAVGYLRDAVRALRDHGAQVVVATCPDLGAVRPIHPPLRWVVRRVSRSLARAQRAAVLPEGAFVVPLGDLIGPTFAADPETMFGEDRYHPSAVGYRVAVEAVLPTVFQVLATLTPVHRSETAVHSSGSAGMSAGRSPRGAVR